MIPHTYPTFMDAQKKAYMKVFFLSSVSGLTKWIDYIPVKTVAFSATNEGTTNTGGHMTVTQVASDTALAKWRDYIPVYEDASATVAWSSNANGYIPVCQLLSLDFTAGIIDSRITFARADAVTCATYFDSTGRMQTVAANVARFDYDPATLLPRGLLIEESRKNNLLHSRDMTQAAWTKTDVTPARTQVGIDGVANTACLMTEGVAGTSGTSQNGAAVTAGSTITASIVMKRGNTDWVRLKFGESTAVDHSLAYFNLATGAKGSVVNNGAATLGASTISNLGGGWYRLTITTLPNGTYTVPRFEFMSATADLNATRVANATYIVDCAQLEVGAFATSILPTTTTALTRAADSASMTGANFSSWFNASAGTFVAEYSRYQNIDTFGVVYEAKSTSTATTDRILAGASATADPRFQQYIGGVSQIDSINTYAVVAAGTTVKIANAYLSGDSAATRNGAALTTSATAFAAPAYTNLQIGGTDNTQYGPSATHYINGHIRSLRYYPTRLPNATLQALTS